MRYGVLGATQVLGPGGVDVPVGGPRARALLVLLLLDAGRIVPAERLIDGLYGDSPPAGASNALQSQVSRLRQAVGEYAPVEFHPAGYRLAVDPDDVDAHRFARLAAEGQRALGAGDPAGAVAVLREGLALWRGPALADAPYAAGQAARLEELRLTAVEDRIEAEVALGAATGQLVADLRDIVDAQPLRERPRVLLMRALHGLGRPAEALAAYEDARRVFADELGTGPSPELAALHVAILRDEVARPPGLPGQLTSFVGREEELRRVGKLLAEARLVTVHGPGGAGKTRLAVEAAGRHEGEVCFVELATLRPPGVDGDPGPRDGVARAMLGALGLREAGLRGTADPRDAAERLVDALADRRLLVVLDNCEHVVTEAARLAARILAAAPGVRVLATSREPLGITGEALCPLFGLAIPPDPASAPSTMADPGSAPGRGAGSAPASTQPAVPNPPVGAAPTHPAPAQPADRMSEPAPGSATAPAQMATRAQAGGPGPTTTAASAREVGSASAGASGDVSMYPAVRLFADRAADAVPGFTISASNVDDVLRVVRTLDGLPLAIELAAARLRALPVAEVAARLDDRFRLLTRGSRAAQPRHQTLRAVVEWSWDLLDGAERALARRLTVFAGGATLDAAERVCGADIDVLASLVDKSLVVATDGRYRMLETVRAFCAERLAEAGEQGAVRAAHTAYFLDLARTADPHLRRAEQLEWLRRLDAERDNLRVALARAVDDDPPAALRLLSALSFYWWMRGLRTEGAVLAARLLETVGEPPEELAEEYAVCAITAHLGGAADVPLRPLATEQIIPGLGRPPRQPFLLYLSAMATGPPDEGPLTMSEMVAQWGPIFGDDPWIHALSAIGAGLIQFFRQRVDEAAREIERALDGFRAIGERWGMMLALAATAEFADGRGDHAAAVAPMSEALRLAEELGSTVDMADLLRTRGDGRVAAGDLEGARADYERSAALARRCGATEMVAAAHLGLAEAARRGGDPATARRWCQQALADCPTGWFSADATRFGVLVAHGRIAQDEGDEAAASDWYRRALAATAGVRTMPLAVDAVEGLLALTPPREASALLGAAAALEALPREQARARAASGAAFDRAAALSREDALALLMGEG